MTDSIDKALDDLTKRVKFCEDMFLKFMQMDMRIDSLEFNSDLPVKPAISAKFLDMQLRLEALENHLFKKENHDV